MKIKQYRPNYFSGFENQENNFKNTKELLNIQWIKDFSNFKNFYRFSLSRNKNGNNHTLMAEFNKGCQWWVIGFINEININSLDNLKEWKPKKNNV